MRTVSLQLFPEAGVPCSPQVTFHCQQFVITQSGPLSSVRLNILSLGEIRGTWVNVKIMLLFRWQEIWEWNCWRDAAFQVIQEGSYSSMRGSHGQASKVSNLHQIYIRHWSDMSPPFLNFTILLWAVELIRCPKLVYVKRENVSLGWLAYILILISN